MTNLFPEVFEVDITADCRVELYPSSEKDTVYVSWGNTKPDMQQTLDGLLTIKTVSPEIEIDLDEVNGDRISIKGSNIGIGVMRGGKIESGAVITGQYNGTAKKEDKNFIKIFVPKNTIVTVNIQEGGSVQLIGATPYLTVNRV